MKKIREIQIVQIAKGTDTVMVSVPFLFFLHPRCRISGWF